MLLWYLPLTVMYLVHHSLKFCIDKYARSKKRKRWKLASLKPEWIPVNLRIKKLYPSLYPCIQILSPQAPKTCTTAIMLEWMPKNGTKSCLYPSFIYRYVFFSNWWCKKLIHPTVCSIFGLSDSFFGLYLLYSYKFKIIFKKWNLFGLHTDCLLTCHWSILNQD